MAIKTQKTVYYLLIAAALVCSFCQRSWAQAGVLDPNDPIVVYNPAKPPEVPVFGRLAKWVKSNRLNWNTSSFKAYFYKGMAFRVKFPSSYQHGVLDGKLYPIMVAFHGRGEAGTIYDNEYQLYHGGDTHRKAVENGQFDGFLLYPQNTTGFFGDSYYAIIAELIQKYFIPEVKVDPSRILVGGLSAGGEAAWRFAIQYPQLVACSAPISNASLEYRNYVGSLKYIPIWHFQGEMDNSPAPTTSKEVAKALQSVGANYKYTEYPGQGHSCWNLAWAEKDYFPYLGRQHKANPWPLGGRSEFCPGDSVKVTLGIQNGYAAYEWRRNGVLISGATTNELKVSEFGVYDCRYYTNGVWSAWSPQPANIRLKAPTIAPEIGMSGLMSSVLPAPDGRDSVVLEVPAGYETYQWQNASGDVLGTNRYLTVRQPGSYRVQVNEVFGCSSDFSLPFEVVNANGTAKPDAAIGVGVTATGKTSLRISWSDNPAPHINETAFEVYRSAKAGGPYALVGLTGSNEVSFNDSNLNAATRYYYVVRAVGSSGAAPVTAEASGITLADVLPPSAPTDLQVVATSRDAISLSWNESVDDVGVMKYDVYIDGVKSFVTNETRFTAYNLERGRSYRFAVKARDAAGNISAFSNQVSAHAVLSGLTYKYYTYAGTWNKLPDFSTLTPVKTGNTPNISVAPRTQTDRFAFLWEGYIDIPVSGTYTFRTTSDDGSRFFLGRYDATATPLVDNDGIHGQQNRDGTVTLQAGSYPIALAYFDGTNNDIISLSWSTPQSGGVFVPVPNTAFTDAVAAADPAPAAPSNVQAQTVSYNRIRVSWTDNSTNELGFEVYRSLSAFTGFVTIATTGANIISYEDSTVEANTRYYYKVKAIGNSGESESAFNMTEAAWRFNNNYFDSSSNKRVLTPASNPIIDATQKREGTHSVLLNGTSQSLLINTTDGYLRNTYSEKTIAFWMQSATNIGNRIIFDIGGNDDGLAMRVDNNTLYTAIASNNVRATFSVPFASTSWTHVVLVYQGNTLTLYLNGEKAGELVGLGFYSITNTTNGSRIGQTESTNAFNITCNRFAGSIDHFSIYSTALNAGDIKAIMTNTLGESYATTHPKPGMLADPEGLLASAESPSQVALKWVYNPAQVQTIVTPAKTVRVEAEDYVNQSGVSIQNSSEGGRNVTSIGQGDWMEYNINVPVTGSYTFNFRVANTTNNVQFDIRQLDGTVLGVMDVPRTAGTQVYTTLTKAFNLPAGMQTIRIFASRNSNWNFNWFEIIIGEQSTSVPLTNQASALELYRSSNNNGNYQLLASLPANARSFTDSSLFSNAVYYYRLQAVNEISRSQWSNEDSARTQNNRPMLAHIGEQYMRYGTELQVPVVATDRDAEAMTLSFANLPSFASFTGTGNGTGIITFSPSVVDQGSYDSLSVLATDLQGGVDSTTFRLVVNDNYQPHITPAADLTIAEQQVAQIVLHADDQNEADSLHWSFSGLPAFATSLVNGRSVQVGFAPGLSDNGTYNVLARVSDGRNGIDSIKFSINITDVNPNRRVLINFNDGSVQAPAPWNNTAKVPALNDNFANLRDTAGANSGIGMQVTSSWQAIGNGTNMLGAATGNNSGIYPDAVLRSAYWSNTTRQTIRFYGLNPAYRYHYTFFGSRGGVTDDRTSVYTIKGKSVSLNAAGNLRNTVTLSNLQPEPNGTLELELNRGGVSQFSYLNALVIDAQYDDGSAPARPRNLSASIAAGQVQLNWIDAAYNETGYEVYRSATPAGPFSLLNAGRGMPNTTKYTDTAVAGNSTYFYTVRAIKDSIASLYSDTVSITVPNTAPVFRAVGDVYVKTQQVVNISISASDPGDTVTLQAAGLPSFARFTDSGDGNGVLRIAPGNNIGSYPITITARDNRGAMATQSLRIQVTDKDIRSFYINFSQTTTAGTPWNNFATLPLAGRTLNGLGDEAGVRSALNITLVDAWEGANEAGAVTGNNSGIYPDDVIRSAYFESTTAAKRVRISGLDGARKYNLVFFGSRAATDNRLTTYSAAGTTVSLNAAGNNRNTVQINGLFPDASGVIEFQVVKGAGSPFAYLNALVIQEYTETFTPLSPSGLQAVARSKNNVRLSWSDKSDNETAFEVYRAPALSGNFVRIATLESNTQQFEDNGLQANTRYYYRVRALRDTVASGFTNTAGAATFAFSVSVNFNRDNPAAAPWNNTNNVPMVGSVYENLLNEQSNPTGIDLTVMSEFSGENPFGMITGDNSGVVPDNVMRSSWWLDIGVSSTIKISGLSQAMEYSFVFFGSRNGGGDRTTVYSIGNRSTSLQCSYNTTRTAQIDRVRADENGDVYVTVSLGPNATFGYLGALIIQGYQPVAEELAPAASATQTTAAAIKVQQSGLATPKSMEALLAAEPSLAAYPNPFREEFTLRMQLGKPTAKLMVRLVDAAGNQVLVRQFANLPAGTWQTPVNVSQLPAGLYFLQVVAPDGSKPQTFRLMKMQ